ncbi:MAG: TolC family protein [Pseudomonadota bacterium]
MRRTLIYNACILLLLLTTNALAAKMINIGIVIDGPMDPTGWSPALFKEELLFLTKGEHEIRFPEDKQLDGAWSAKQIAAAFEKLQNDPAVDMVLALGYTSSAVAALSPRLRKPTFAPFVMDASLLGLPRKGNTSGVKNLNYLTSEADFVRDLKIFRSVVAFKNVTALVDQTTFDVQPQLIQRAREVAAAGGVELRFVLQTQADEDLAAKLPADTQAVVVTSMPRLSTNAMQELISALREKRIPSYSLIGSHLVEQGLLASEVEASDWQRLARRNALNMHAVLRGEQAGNQPVIFTSKRRLTINMATARAIGVYPRFDVLNEAILLSEIPEPRGRALSLSAVALEAVAANLDLRAAEVSLKAGETNVTEARAGLRPQLRAELNYNQTNSDSTSVASGAFAERSTSAALTLSQLLYSDRVRADVEIQRYLQDNRAALYRQLELDIVQEATLAYLNLLKAQTFVQIRRENMQLTRSNLELAQDRQRIGVANPSEVYRWESELATARKELLNAQAQQQQARDAVNRLLHHPLTEPFIATPATLDDPSLIVSRKVLFDYIANHRAFELMGEFMEMDAIKAAPELVGLDALIAATEREIKANERAYWSPTVTLQGQVTNVLEEERRAGLPAEGDTDWRVGVNVALPLFEGGARRARLTGSRLTLDQRRTQEDAARERIAQRLRFNLYRIAASHPAIELSQSAATAAQKNLELITDAYMRGTLSIIDLLDAQNAALVAEESATNAVFDFLIDLMNLQRSAGNFDFFTDAQGLDTWLERLKNYIAAQEPPKR